MIILIFTKYLGYIKASINYFCNLIFPLKFLIELVTFYEVNSYSGYIHYDPLMMQQKEARRKHPCVLPKKVDFVV